MVTATDIKLLPYFNDNFPVRPRFQKIILIARITFH